MLLAFTGGEHRVRFWTVIADWNLLTVRTKVAAGRACRPTLLRIAKVTVFILHRDNDAIRIQAQCCLQPFLQPVKGYGQGDERLEVN